MEEEIKTELQELKNLEDAGETLDDAQQSRLTILNALDEAEKTAAQKSKDLESALAQKEHFRTKFEETEKKKSESSKSEIKPEESKQTSDLSPVDIIALSKVHEDDIPEVLEYAKFKKIPIKEALKSPVIKATLAENEEQRKTAETTNVSTARRSNQKATGETLLNNASKGKFPESDEEIAALAKEAYHGSRK